MSCSWLGAIESASAVSWCLVFDTNEKHYNEIKVLSTFVRDRITRSSEPGRGPTAFRKVWMS
jgi:hypothetical protein